MPMPSSRSVGMTSACTKCHPASVCTARDDAKGCLAAMPCRSRPLSMDRALGTVGITPGHAQRTSTSRTHRLHSSWHALMGCT